MSDNKHDLAIFDPIIRNWFSEQVGTPTSVQQLAWPVIADHKHVLITAPTGSGKTLTAFLWAIDQLITEKWPAGTVRVLYISPLKALNNDVQKNLLKPLAEIRDYFTKAGAHFPDIAVLTRSGDTSEKERRTMRSHPPEILITTPESLNILLTSKSGRKMLTGLRSVILDEVHSVIAGKRGTHLITAVDRLVPLSGEFQRIALSATVNPLQRVADFVGGYRLLVNGHKEKRRIEIIQSKDTKKYDVSVVYPESARDMPDAESIWPALIEDFSKIVRDHSSTLFFTNSRKMAEKVTRLVNEHEADMVSYAHHGSLSREVRLVVEQKMKAGELKSIVATNSLEMGIDIGELDNVVLLQTPFSISSAIQRIGRSGHRVGEVSKGALYPTHGRDMIDSAVMARSVIDQDIEEIRPVDCPLDILAQVILSMTCTEEWDIDELYDRLVCSYPYRDLSRKQFALVLEMLAGRYSDSHVRELTSRVSLDKVDNTVKAKDGVPFLLYMSGGTIPDRGMYDLRLQDSKVKIGELDEEFVWERNVGDSFTLGSQTWRIINITHNDVEVVAADNRAGMFPFWKAEQRNRDFHFSQKIMDFLDYANTHLEEESFAGHLQSKHYMAEGAARELTDFLKRQVDITGVPLPHRRHIVIEHFNDPMNLSDNKQVILHTLWGGAVNQPFCMALSAAWEEKYQYTLEIMADNDAIVLMLPHRFHVQDLFDLLDPDKVEYYLRRKLETTGYFGARFRENAGRALLLTRSSFRRRLPLWLNRLKSKKLFDSVIGYEDFPILLETWRTCLQDEFDLPNLKLLLDEIDRGEITISETITRNASPFSSSLIWKQTNKYMYEDDTPSGGKTSNLSENLVREVAASRKLRPLIPDDIIQQLEGRLQRTVQGYTPEGPVELLDWLKERVLIPFDEWDCLLEMTAENIPADKHSLLEGIYTKAVSIQFPDAQQKCVVAVEQLPLVAGKGLGVEKAEPDWLVQQLSVESLDTTGTNDREIMENLKRIASNDNTAADNGDDTSLSIKQEIAFSDLLRQWLVFYGPVSREKIRSLFGLSEEMLELVIEDITETGDAVFDIIRQDSDTAELCDSENLEILLRMLRRSRQPVFKTRPVEDLPYFLAVYNGVVDSGKEPESMQTVLDRLFGYPAAANAWEEYIFPARLDPYYTTWLDSLTQTSDLVWMGCGQKKILFMFKEDRELFTGPESSDDQSPLIRQLLAKARSVFGFHELSESTGLNSEQLSEALWEAAWQGKITNDTFDVVRKGLANRFKAVSAGTGGPVSRRGGFNRWQASRPMAGNWHVFPVGVIANDLMEEAELVRDRIRQVLLRYGIIFRELLEREMPQLRWKSLFRTLRLMELSGEVLTGYFFEGISGVQFISHDAFRVLTKLEVEKKIYWLNACDPVSLCGINLDQLKGRLPKRIQSNWVVYSGNRLVMSITRNGEEMEILTPPDNENLVQYAQIFKDLLNRQYNPFKSVKISIINGRPVKESPYKKVFTEMGFQDLWDHMQLVKRY